ncbi:HxlR family transcriptional regulator [Nocardia sp. 852002-20019_SCH5090214]|uniref:Transcriptional regulator n=1 Tax=Nocardia nova TaxID=37330 RepID=A0A2S5ZV70_9NOCA|nr:MULTISPECIES: helix-turn-helix domain-containing protein [Nocardia]OBF65998.1 HxlR family transcriptional regulator [Mycobacterium sp. 852002-51759_SCH5129042]MBF6274968.1 helix-turn-helix transcriptional regulator [Nocardia nova]MBV7708186.1 helix-turn-helix transcriptional regulator [Nocardia nova]OBA51077.1 HxlR family transcriptional regulator [Nocardia sp. 852002-51101_SCH5132738]OBA57388.1 HxlR family transcriptional regulator [Nocardia sp. 852002-20019_SCH5090214]
MTSRQLRSADDADPTLEADVFARNCRSRPVLQNVASRWGALALVALREGPYRFSALRRRVDGISERMLSQTLQALERDGMIHREVQQTIPPRVEYTLTELGEQVADQLYGLIAILEDNIDVISTAQDIYHRD